RGCGTVSPVPREDSPAGDGPRIDRDSKRLCLDCVSLTPKEFAMPETVLQQPSRTTDGRRPKMSGEGQAPRTTATPVALPPAAATATVSGQYAWKQPSAVPFARAELRLDVDGEFPLNTASGREFAGVSRHVYWVARPLSAEVTPDGTVWSGPISYK